MIARLLTLANAGTYTGKSEFFYPFKTRFLRERAAHDGYDKQTIVHKCFNCRGTGIYSTCLLCTFGGSCSECNRGIVNEPCRKCALTPGIFRVDTNWLERRAFRGYVFHIPVTAYEMPLLTSDPVETFTGKIWHKYVPDYIAWRSALLLFALYDRRTLWQIVRGTAVKSWNRAIRYLACAWNEYRTGPIPF